jgi:hypothetical protein
MKMLIIALLSTIASTAFAAHPAGEIAACSSEELVSLKKTIADKKADGFSNIKLMVNTKNQVVGLYAWDEENLGIFAEVCEYFYADNNIVAASEWYYWQTDDEKENPAGFKKGHTYELAQDEGLAEFRVLNPAKNGNVTVEFSVIGWRSDVDEEAKITLRKSVLTFINE